MKNNNGHDALDALLNALAERAGIKAAPRDDDAFTELDRKIDRLAAAVERLTELVENRPANNGVQPRLLSRSDTATLFGVSVSQVDNLRRLGRLRATVIETKPLYDLADIDAFIESAREKTAPHVAVADD